MPVTGILAADFSAFYDAVQKADVQLKDFEGDAAKVEKSLSRMADSFSGQKVISEATLMAEVFERMGGASKFTTEELDRMGTTAAAAVNKMKALGQEVPKDLQTLADATTKASSATGELQSSYKQLDGALAGLGINMAPHIKGLEDIASASGKTAKELGVFGTSAAIAAAAVVGWNFGKWIDSWSGLSGAIESATKSLMGWNTASQTAGAVQDTINRAIANGASATISYAEAIKFNADAMQRNIDGKVDYNKRLEEARALVAGLTAEQMKEIEAGLKLNANKDEIIRKYHLNADALAVLSERTEAQAAADKKAAEEGEAAAKKLQEVWDNYYTARENAMKRMHAAEAKEMEAATAREAAQADMFEQLDIKARINRQAAADAAAKAEEEAMAKSESARIAANQKEIDAILAMGQAHTEGGNLARAGAQQVVEGYQQVAQQVTITGEAVKEWINLMKYTAEVNAILGSGSGLFTTQSQRERIAGLGGGGGGGTTVFNNSYNIVDTESNIAKRVGDNIMRQVKAGTQLGTA